MARFRFSLASLILIVLLACLICAFLYQSRRALHLRDELQAERIQTKETLRLERVEKAIYRAMASESEAFRRKLAETSKELDELRRRVTSVLEQSLSDDAPAVRSWAARVLGEIGPDAKRAVTGLTESLNDPDEGVRDAAAAALKKIKLESHWSPPASP